MAKGKNNTDKLNIAEPSTDEVVNLDNAYTEKEVVEEVVASINPKKVEVVPIIKYQNLLKQKIDLQGINKSYTIQPSAIFVVDTIDDATFKLNNKLKRL